MLPVHPDGPVTDHVTGPPVPVTVAVNCCVVPIVADEGVTVMVGVTVTCALPDFVVSSVEVAVIVAVPVVAGVNSPVVEIVPIPAGPTDHVTALLNSPVPVTVAVACAVCAVSIDGELTITDTLVIDGAGFTITVVLPDFVVSSVEVAVIVAVPVVAGVNSAVVEIVPMLAGLTDHVTALL
jgi:hypothetical protein